MFKVPQISILQAVSGHIRGSNQFYITNIINTLFCLLNSQNINYRLLKLFLKLHKFHNFRESHIKTCKKCRFYYAIFNFICPDK